MNNIPRSEHPMPIFERASWRNLNGEWDFAFDFGKSAVERRLWEQEKWERKITVPFCPESRLSGIGYTDFMNAVAYRRTVTISEDELSGRVLLHFGAVDYRTLVYVNGKLAGEHLGGYTSFSFDITELLTVGENQIFVSAEDDVRSERQPAGKQCRKYASCVCDYTRTTGIWQTVWLEFVPKAYIKSVKYYPDIENGVLTIDAVTVGCGSLRAVASYEGRTVADVTAVSNGHVMLTLPLSELHLWEIGNGRLYDLSLSFGEDVVSSYFGMRSSRYEGHKYLLNNRSVFMRFVLDQGFYPEGIYTAPSDADLKKDIELSLAVGFNGARLHEKVFEPRFLYHCDRMGYPVFGEFPNWQMDHHDPQTTETVMNQWQEAVLRDFNNPAVIGWCPYNETWGYREESAKNAAISSIYKLTKHLDPTRPCIDVSGNFHITPEVYDIHDYDQNVETFRTRYDEFAKAITARGKLPLSDDYFVKVDPQQGHRHPFFDQPYGGDPIFISEYGGIRWNTDGNQGWGYGSAPKTEEEFIARYRGLTDVLLDNPLISGFCYTQLYDIEQEINGLYTYDRRPKFDVEIFKAINTRKAKIED